MLQALHTHLPKSELHVCLVQHTVLDHANNPNEWFNNIGVCVEFKDVLRVGYPHH